LRRDGLAGGRWSGWAPEGMGAARGGRRRPDGGGRGTGFAALRPDGGALVRVWRARRGAV